MAWISVEQTLIGKKLRVLAKDVGCSRNEAIGILINLWLWGMDNASMDGLMDGADIADIALAIKPCLSESLDPEEVVRKLLDNGWIDCNEENLFIGSISAGGYTAFSGAIPIVCEITNNGNSWTYSHLRVYNGIIVGYWN